MALYNETKLRLLAAVDYLNSNNLPANSNTISRLVGISKGATKVGLRDHRSLFSIKYDKKCTDRCMLKYSLNKNGTKRLNLLLDRFENGQHLKLREKPIPYDWTGFVLLPGLVEKEKEN